MRLIEKQLAKSALVESIICDFHYPVIDAAGRLFWKRSYVLPDSVFRQLMTSEVLCEALKKSQGETFLFDKTLERTTIRQRYPAGSLFYDWFESASLSAPPPKYELSNDSLLLGGIAGRLGINIRHFMQFDPLSPVAGNALLQGELIDAFGRRVYEQMKKAGFKERSGQRNREIQSIISKTERYFGRLENNHPNLGIQRLELHYRSDQSIADLSVIENTRHLEELIATLQEQDTTGVFVGYWWKRRYLPECGYGIHLILFHDAQRGDLTEVSRRTREIWQQVTHGFGTVFDLLPAPENHRSWGSGTVNSPYHSTSPLDEVATSVMRMMQSERYLQLSPHTKYVHCGMGELPPAAPRGNEWQEGSQVKSIFEMTQENTPFIRASLR